MFKKILCSLAGAALLFGMSACSSVEISASLNDQKLAADPQLSSVAHINSEIWGIYFFNVPIFAGSSERPGRMTAFTDTVNVRNGVNMLTKSANEMECKYTLDLQSARNSTWLFPSLFFWYKSVQVSGNALK